MCGKSRGLGFLDARKVVEFFVLSTPRGVFERKTCRCSGRSGVGGGWRLGSQRGVKVKLELGRGKRDHDRTKTMVMGASGIEGL